MSQARVFALLLLLPACGGSHAAAPATTAARTANPAPAPAATPVAAPVVTARPDLAFVGKLVTVGRAPGFWSGGLMAIQELTYEVTDVLAGAPMTGQVTVRFVIVASSSLVGDRPELRPGLTQVGQTYIVSLMNDPHFGQLASDVVVATPALIDQTRKDLAR